MNPIVERSSMRQRSAQEQTDEKPELYSSSSTKFTSTVRGSDPLALKDIKSFHQIQHSTHWGLTAPLGLLLEQLSQWTHEYTK